MPKRFFSLLFLILGFIVNDLALANPASSEELNHLFRSYYHQAREKALQSLGPIFIVKGDHLSLIYKNQKQEVQYLPSLYHRLKEIDHIPLALEIVLEHLELSEDLHAFEKWIQIIQEEIPRIFPAELIENQDIILGRTFAFIQEIKSKNQVNPDELLNFCRTISPYLLKNAEEAAFIQLDALHKQIQKWKKDIASDDWNKMAAIVIGPQMPRVGEITLQYFARLTGKSLSNTQILPSWLSLGEADSETLKPSKKNRRLIYAENLWQEEEALNLLATHLLDERIGFMFFNDNQRMHCDLLAEAASRRLEEICDQHSAK